MGVGTMGYPELPPAQAFLSPYARQQTNRGNPISDSPPFPVSSVMYNTVSCVLTPDVFSNSELICRLPCMELRTITVERRKRTPKENPVHISL